jgi:hypothetical protein
MKRARSPVLIAEPRAEQALDALPGKAQLLLKNAELQTQLGKKYCGQTELVDLLLSHTPYTASGVREGMKHARPSDLNAEPRAEPNNAEQALGALPGKAQFLLKNAELQTQFGKKYCGQTELVDLLLSHGFVRRVRTIDVEVRPLGGDSFRVTVDARSPSVQKLKAGIAYTQGTPEAQQELYKVAVRIDGGAVREDDAEPEPLEDDTVELADGSVVAMAVTDNIAWYTFPDDRVALRDNGAVATQRCKKAHADVGHGFSGAWSLTTSGVELTEGRHYWEVELVSYNIKEIHVGICRTQLDARACYLDEDNNSGWFMCASEGSLWGNGKSAEDSAGRCEQGDRIGLMLDFDEGSLLFFKNGQQHGPGFPAGSVEGGVVHALQMFSSGQSARLIPNAQLPLPQLADDTGGAQSDEVQRDASGLALFSYKR